jgi:hypothetical protein
MTRFELKSRPYDLAALQRQIAKETDAEKWCTEPGVYHVDGRPAIIYGRLPTHSSDRTLWAVSSIPFTQEKRTVAGGNIKSGVRIATSKKDGLGKSCIFGFRPPIAYNPFGAIPGPTALTKSYPAQYEELCRLGRSLQEEYRAGAPGEFARHEAMLRDVIPEYIIPGTIFTSGIVNQNNALKYHFDKGNFEGVMSCMAVFRSLTGGGHLVIPELGAGFTLDDHSYLLFDGQRYLHGVTPIHRMNKRSYRYSVVFYSLRAMARCETQEKELRAARLKRVEIERRRI